MFCTIYIRMVHNIVHCHLEHESNHVCPFCNKHFLIINNRLKCRVGPIDNAIVHRRWLTDITMLSRNRDPPPIFLSLSLDNYTVYKLYHIFYKIRCLSVVLSICKSFAIVLSVISPYSVYVVSELSCTVIGC